MTEVPKERKGELHGSLREEHSRLNNAGAKSPRSEKPDILETQLGPRSWDIGP